MESAERDIRDRKSNKENDRSNVDKVLNLDFGAHPLNCPNYSNRCLIPFCTGPNSRFAPLYGVELKGDFGEYTYSLSPFAEAKQSYTSLGNFASWKTPYTVPLVFKVLVSLIFPFLVLRIPVR